MHKTPRCRVLALALAASFGLASPAHQALAQPRATPVADPADPQSPSSPLIYRSPLQRYQALQDPTLRDWRAANQRVHEAGGWRVYLRESQAGAPASAPSAASSPADGKSKPAASPAHQH